MPGAPQLMLQQRLRQGEALALTLGVAVGVKGEMEGEAVAEALGERQTQTTAG